MSHKKSKAARKTVRESGLHPRHVETVPARSVFIPPLLPGKPGAMFLGDRRLTPTCGRGIYKSLKRAVVRREVA